jgi:WD40 repeat protein/uncharacterized caspase-like protein
MAAALRCLVAILMFVAAASMARAEEAASFFLDLDTGGHRAFVKDMAFTPDGQYLVSGSDDKTIRIWDWRAGRSIRTLRGQVGPGNEGKVFAVAVSPDGRTIAAGGYFGPGLGEKPPYGDVRLFDFNTGRIVTVLKGHEFAVYSVAFSPDGRTIAAGGQDGYVYLWRQDPSAEGGWAPAERLDADSQHLSRVAFAAGGTRIVAATADNGIRLWDFSTRAEIALQEVAEALRDRPVMALAVSGDGALFATGSADGVIQVWNAADGALVRTLPKQDFDVGSLTFAGGARSLVASCGYRCTDRFRTLVWTLGDDKPALEYRAHDGIVLASAETPDGLLVATTGGTAHEIHIWDPLTGERRQILSGRGRPVTALGLSARGQAIAWGTENPCPARNACPETMGRLTDTLALPSPQLFFEHPQKLPAGRENQFRRAVLAAADWSLAAAAGGPDGLDNAVLEIAKEGAVRHRIENDATNGYLHAAFTLVEQGSRTITGGNDGTLLEYETGTGKFAGSFSGGHSGEIQAIVALEAANLLVTGSADQTICLWNLKTRELIATFYFDQTDWVVWMPQGYYNSSHEGDGRFGWHVNQGQDRESRFVRAGQLKTFLHSPELVRRAIVLRSATAAIAEMRPGAERQLAGLLGRKPPEFDIRLAEDQSGVREGFVAVEVTGADDPEAAVAEFSVLANSRHVGGAVTRAVTGSDRRTIIEVPVEEGQNAISVTGVDAQGYVTERSVTALGRRKRESAPRGKLYVAVIGVDRYPNLPDACNGRSCDLKFPVADAGAFLDVVTDRTAPLFSGVETLVLLNRDSLPDARRFERDKVLEPDADTIADELQDFLEKPGPDDTAIVFVAGHGINIDEDYYFIPTDGRRQDGDRWRRSSLVEWSDIQKAIERAKGMRFLVLDTCHAANAFNPRLEKDAADARIVVFSATAANNTALEMAELGHGVFTYALLEGLRGKARTGSEGVTLFGLADYVGREVASLTASRQKPFYYVGGVENLLMARP